MDPLGFAFQSLSLEPRTSAPALITATKPRFVKQVAKKKSLLTVAHDNFFIIGKCLDVRSLTRLMRVSRSFHSDELCNILVHGRGDLSKLYQKRKRGNLEFSLDQISDRWKKGLKVHANTIRDLNFCQVLGITPDNLQLLLTAYPQVTTLDLSKTEIGDLQIGKLQKTNITKLNLVGNESVTDKAFTTLKELPLVTLELGGQDLLRGQELRSITSLGFCELKAHETLQVLILKCMFISRGAFPALSELKVLHTLRFVRCEIADYTAFKELKKLKSLWVLELRNMLLRDRELDNLDGLSIKKLSLAHSSVTDHGLYALSRCVELLISDLYLSFCEKITDTGIQALSEGALRLTIQTLSFGNKKITRASGAFLRPDRFPYLQRLILTDCPLEEHTTKRSLFSFGPKRLTLQSLVGLKLTHLEIHQNDGSISDDALQFLKDMPLKALYIKGAEIKGYGLCHLIHTSLEDLTIEQYWNRIKAKHLATFVKPSLKRLAITCDDPLPVKQTAQNFPHAVITWL